MIHNEVWVGENKLPLGDISAQEGSFTNTDHLSLHLGWGCSLGSRALLPAGVTSLDGAPPCCLATANTGEPAKAKATAGSLVTGQLPSHLLPQIFLLKPPSQWVPLQLPHVAMFACLFNYAHLACRLRQKVKPQESFQASVSPAQPAGSQHEACASQLSPALLLTLGGWEESSLLVWYFRPDANRPFQPSLHCVYPLGFFSKQVLWMLCRGAERG